MDLTVKDAAKLLHTSENTLYRWIRDGSMPCYRVGDRYRLNRVELLEWATGRGINISPEIFDHQPQPRANNLLAEAMRRGGVIRDVAGVDKPAVLQAVCQLLPLPQTANRQDLYNVLLAREALSSTAIGDGIAIPHPRSPIVLGVTQPTITMALLPQPVDFGALDGKPVSTLFVIISTTVRLHLQLLSHLMYVLQDRPFRAMLDSRAAGEQLLEQAAKVEAMINRGGEVANGGGEGASR